MIGFSDQGRSTNDFAWFDGSTVVYTNWGSGEPSNNSTSRGTEDCAQITTTGAWNDLPCTDGGPAICKFAP